MYVSPNCKTKKQLKEALAAGRFVDVYQQNGDLFGTEPPRNGSVALEGPHAPEMHRWYALGTMKDGRLVSVR